MPYVIVAYRKNAVKDIRETVTFISTLLIFGFYDFKPFAILTFFLFAARGNTNIRLKRTGVKIVTHVALLI